jgi:heme exporter protein D
MRVVALNNWFAAQGGYQPFISWAWLLTLGAVVVLLALTVVMVQRRRRGS